VLDKVKLRGWRQEKILIRKYAKKMIPYTKLPIFFFFLFFIQSHITATRQTTQALNLLRLSTRKFILFTKLLYVLAYKRFIHFYFGCLLFFVHGKVNFHARNNTSHKHFTKFLNSSVVHSCFYYTP